MDDGGEAGEAGVDVDADANANGDHMIGCANVCSVC